MGLAAEWRPFRCYRLNVELETGEPAISGPSARQLHISDNFTLIDNQPIRIRVIAQAHGKSLIGERGSEIRQ